MKVVPISAPNETIVATLEDALDMAKRGKVHALAIAFEGQGCVMTARVFGNSSNKFAIIGAISLLHYEAMTFDIEH